MLKLAGALGGNSGDCSLAVGPGGEVAALRHMGELTLRDPFTGVYNRRHLYEIMASWKALAEKL